MTETEIPSCIVAISTRFISSWNHLFGICTIRSQTVGIPIWRSPPPSMAIVIRFTAAALSVLSFSSRSRRGNATQFPHHLLTFVFICPIITAIVLVRFKTPARCASVRQSASPDVSTPAIRFRCQSTCLQVSEQRRPCSIEQLVHLTRWFSSFQWNFIVHFWATQPHHIP
jgi:hypothetical protein